MHAAACPSHTDMKRTFLTSSSCTLNYACSRGELQCIGATTLDEYRKHIEKDPALER